MHEHVTYKLFEKYQMWKKSFNWRNMELDENSAKVKEHLNWQLKILSLIMFQKTKAKINMVLLRFNRYIMLAEKLKVN